MSTSSIVPLPSVQWPAAARLPMPWISCAEHRAALQQQLEAVVVGRVVAAGDLDAAVDVEIVGREIEHRRGAHADLHDVDAALGEAADQRGLEHCREWVRPSRPTAIRRAPSPWAMRGKVRPSA